MVGSTLGHYRILELLGKGGMGEVYLADDTKLQRRVALKILSPDLALDAERRERFEREARAAASLNHPNIVTIHSVETAGDVVFLTLELVDGQTLADMLPPSGLSIDRILTIAIPLTDAVGAAHQRGIVHRDLKPANVMIATDGRVKVLDFGLAKLREDHQLPDNSVGPTRGLTGEGRILGTVAYMSPEQAEGRTVDLRSDVFSLGVMLYEMAAGERPFKGDSTISILSSILRDTPPPLSDLKRELPGDFARIVKRCLAKDPEDRYQTAKDLRNDLRALRDDLNSGERASVASSSVRSGVAPVSQLDVKSPGRSRAIIATAVIVVVAVAIAGWKFWPQGGASQSAPRAVGEPFASVALTRLTTTGTAGLAALSGDGRYVAHVVSDERGRSLWLRQVTTSSNVQIVPPADVRYAGVTFSPDGDHVYYVIYPSGQLYASLQQVPVLGGGARKIVDDVDTAPGFSPDGKRFAFARGTETGKSMLMQADTDGGQVRELAVRSAPLRYTLGLQTVAWSPDGLSIAAAGIDDSKLTSDIALVDSASGEEHVLGGSQWRAVNGLAWLPDGRGLLVNAQEAGGESNSQIWFVSYPGGIARRITNDLSPYSGLSLSRDARSLVTVRGEQRAAIWLAPLEGSEPAHGIAGAGADDGVLGLAWAPDGRIVFTSAASGNSDIWIMNADGSNRVQLTTARADDTLPNVTADGRYIVFVSERDGTRSLWRMDTSGGSQTRLTEERVSGSLFGPSLSTDGSSIFFTNDKGVNLKTDIDGRATAPVFEIPAGGTPPALPDRLHDLHLSADGRTLTGHYMDSTARAERLAVVPLADPAAAKLFPNVRNNAQWSLDGRSVVFFDVQRGVGNLWRQSLAGGAPVQVTHFDSDLIFHHALAPDKKRVAIVRGSTISDVILITDRAPEAPPESR